ncbi:VOC family protein [Paenibacillus gansuensis]|uniref:VOC family protein n=1 Tax=Paenibacillus gansuensis TaxID=306542 RepID=A0ABW5PIA3_9BACL
MITHFAELQLQTVSISGVKQFYSELLGISVLFEKENEISFRPTEQFSLTFKEAAEPLAPAHFAFEVPWSEFELVVSRLAGNGITLLKWPDGSTVEESETTRNVYFRDGDGNLLEVIAHSYIKEGVLPPEGEMKILYLREIGFPADDAVDFREFVADLLGLRIDKAADNFAFAIGGTAHMVIPSKQRKWIPIAMVALPPVMSVTFGVSSLDYINEVKVKLTERGMKSRMEDGRLSFQYKEYPVSLVVTDFPEALLERLGLPFAK